MNIILSGANGAMGQFIQKLVNENTNLNIVAGIDKNFADTANFNQYSSFKDVPDDLNADVIIDFSHFSVVDELLDYCENTNCPAVICTTALEKNTELRIKELSSKIAFFKSANMSIGIHVLTNLVKNAYSMLGDEFDTEIIEKHHNKKIDAPSGTANMIANAIKSVSDKELKLVYGREGTSSKRTSAEIGMHSIRGGSIVGEHSVIFAGMDEVIEIKHQATSKLVFAKGAVSAAKFLVGRNAGMYDMNDLVSI